MCLLSGDSNSNQQQGRKRSEGGKSAGRAHAMLHEEQRRARKRRGDVLLSPCSVAWEEDSVLSASPPLQRPCFVRFPISPLPCAL